MNYRSLFTSLFTLLTPIVLLGQSISGNVSDERQPLVGANIVVVGTDMGAVSVGDGSFMIDNVPAGEYDVKASFIGYSTVTKTVTVGEENVGIDFVLEVDDTSGFRVGDQIIIEDLDRTQQNEIKQIIDEHNVTLAAELIWDFRVSEGATVLVPSRWVMWSKPESTDYGFVHKETLLKAAQIKWFAEEEVCRLQPHIGPTKF